MPDAKWDARKDYPPYYIAKTTPQLLDLPTFPYVAVQGQGAPESDEFQTKLGALYAVAYGCKFALKKAGQDFGVAGLEGLYWSDYDLTRLEDQEARWGVPRDAWQWKLLIRLPSFVTEDHLATTRAEALQKGKSALVAEVKLGRLCEGLCVQMLHVGPYATEPASILQMRAFMRAQNLTERGRHHEIYLSDPRRGDPAKLRTILRQPVGPLPAG
jgi:hypothetical protein